METKKCKYCGEEIIGKRDDALFCSNTCKAKHWEEKKPSVVVPPKNKTKDVTSQLRGVLQGTVNSNGETNLNSSSPFSNIIIIPTYYSVRATIDKEIRRLTDVRKQLVSEIEQFKDEFENLKLQNGNKWILGMTGVGAAIGNAKSEDKKQGMIIGGLIGLVGGAAMKKFTKNIREKEKREQAEKIVSEINSKVSELNKIDEQILIQKEKIKVLPYLSYKKIPAPASSKQLPSLDLIANTSQVNVTKSPARLQTDVSDVCLTGVDSDKIISSHDLKMMEFKILDFQGKWNLLFGYPSINFHCIVHGMPGEGKSTFAIQFAKYLADNFGRVIYISGEEGFTKTFKDKFSNNNAESKYLDVADLRTYEDLISEIPSDLYNFIFIDSLDNMRIDADKMKKIREKYKNSSLITISQSTKDGKIRGSNELVHDSDIAVRVENGIATTTKNRFKEKGMQFEVF